MPEGAGPLTESQKAFASSKTFLARVPHPNVILLRIVVLAVLLGFFFIGVPILDHIGVIADYKVNLLGKFLSFTLVALGIDLIWGYTGLLSLCQALFFCIGGYLMAMHLSLPQGGGDVRPEYNNIPQFMSYVNVTVLPWFWRPFASMTFTLVAGVTLPTLAGALFGFFILRSRVRGVYFSIVTQALAWASVLLVSRNEMLLGGSNGLTNFYKPMTQARGWIISLYLLTLVIVVLAYLLCLAIVRSRAGRVLVAIRDKETRLYFAGYKPYVFKVFAFAVAALLAGVGGMLYSPQVGIITPQNMSVEESIFMVIWVALGGRGKLWGAIFGAMLVLVARSSLTSDAPSAWMVVLGMTAVCAVLLFPEGFVGLWNKLERQVTLGESLGRILTTALPIVAVAIFVFAEVLGLTPTFLQSHAPFGLPLKYWTLIVVLVAAAVLNVTQSRRDKRFAATRGFAAVDSGRGFAAVDPAESAEAVTGKE
jgi:urea transport system permease protein